MIILVPPTEHELAVVPAPIIANLAIITTSAADNLITTASAASNTTAKYSKTSELTKK